MFAKIKHIAIVTDDGQRLGGFYESVFKLRREASEEGKRFRASHGAVAVTDGYVGLNFNFRKPGRPANLDHFGKISYFKGTGIEKPKLDHIGFEVESLEAVKKDLEALAESGTSIPARTIADGPEGEARLKLLSECGYAGYHFADPNGELLDITQQSTGVSLTAVRAELLSDYG